MDWSTIVASGLLSTLLSLGVTHYQRIRIKNDELKGRALLCYAEINDQAYWMRVQDSLCCASLLKTPDEEWNNSKYYFAHHLSFREFQVIHSHYRSMRSARKIIEIEGALPEPFLSKHLGKADAAMETLANLAELDINKINSYNK